MVEIFPSYYFHYAGQSSIKKDGRQKTLLNDTLSFYDQKFISKLSLEKNDNDDMDAVISCAALKYFLNKQIGFSSNFESEDLSRARKFEGWIYGVH